MIEKYKTIINNNEKNAAAKDALKFLNSLPTAGSVKIVSMLLEDYVERWIEVTDRCGLMKANYDSFLTVDLLRK